MKNERLIFDYVKEKGWTYNPLTGVVTTHMGKIHKGGSRLTNKRTGTSHKYIICCISIDGKQWGFLSHRFAYWFMTGEIPEQIDHIKHCEDPHQMNIFSNLRASNKQKNTFNKDGTKGYMKIVYKSGIVKYRAKIALNGKQIHLGIFDTPEEARQCYLKAKSKLHLQ